MIIIQGSSLLTFRVYFDKLNLYSSAFCCRMLFFPPFISSFRQFRVFHCSTYGGDSPFQLFQRIDNEFAEAGKTDTCDIDNLGNRENISSLKIGKHENFNWEMSQKCYNDIVIPSKPVEINIISKNKKKTIFFIYTTAKTTLLIFCL